jgi:hypothetical protein
MMSRDAVQCELRRIVRQASARSVDVDRCLHVAIQRVADAGRIGIPFARISALAIHSSNG